MLLPALPESLGSPYSDALLNAALDCIVLMDQQGNIVAYNAAAEKTFGYRRDEVIGQEMAGLIIPPSLRPLHRAGLAKFLATGDAPILGQRLEVNGCRRDGSEFPVELTITRLPSDGPPIFAGFLRDLTEQKRDEQRLATHHAVSLVLVEAESIEAMANAVLAAIAENLAWDVGTFWLVQGRENAMTPIAYWGRDAEPDAATAAFEAVTRTSRFTPGIGVPGTVWSQGKPIWVRDLKTRTNFPRQPLALAAGLQTAFAFPITNGTEILGVLDFLRRDTLDEDPEIMRVVEAIGSEIGQFLRRQRIEEELRQAYSRQQNIARWLQDALLPALPAHPPGLKAHAYYRPALEEASIGGDFYDVFPLHNDCHALVVADLSGKGLQAAAQIATVRHMLRSLLYQPERDLAGAVTVLNRMLTDHDLLSGFATLFVGLFDRARQELTYVSCGQEPGLLRRAATGQIEQLPATGAILGSFPDATFVQQTLPIHAGDMLALFTDGLTEAGPNRKDLLGVPGLLSVFRDCTEDASAGVEEITERIMAGVEARATPAGIRDDVCLLVARVE